MAAFIESLPYKCKNVINIVRILKRSSEKMAVELGIVKDPLLLYRLGSIKKRIYTNIGELEAVICTDSEPIPFNRRASGTYRRIEKGEVWGKPFTCSWFNFKGQIPLNIKSQHIVLIIDIDGEGLYVDDSNEPISGITSKISMVDLFQSTKKKSVIEFSDCCGGGEKVDIWIEGGFNGKAGFPYGKARLKKSYIAVCRDDIRELYYDYLTLSYAISATVDRDKQKEIGDALKNAFSLLKGYSADEVKNTREILGAVLLKENTSEELFFTAIGHSHLDLAWLWPLRETRRKAARTFSNALKNIDKYPGYIYGASQPQQFEWIKQDYPPLYTRLKEAVKKGNIELQGGMWTECDTNLPSGESLIRQIYYGKKFFQEEFAQDMKICWLPDVFGYSANLPQILKKTGLDYFMTIKLSWNEHNNFPHRTFNWVGIDNSSLLVHMPPEGDYNSGATPLNVKNASDKFPEKGIIDNALLVYGVGDGGGGPGEVHLELIKRQKNFEGFPPVRFGKAIDYFERLNHSKGKLKSYKGELYLEKHQGTYTTQGHNKYFNRKIEFLLHDIEFLGALAYLSGYPYPSTLLERTWKEVLLYQFHDIIPGSSIKRVYDETTESYNRMFRELDEEKGRILGFLSKGVSKTFINTSSFARVEYIKLKDQWYYTKAESYSSSPLVPAVGPFDLKHGKDFIENEYLRAEFSKEGYIISLYDKVNNIETCGQYLNKFLLYTDVWKFFNAWDIDIKYPKRRKTLLPLVNSKTFIDGPRVIRRNHYKHGKTMLTQDVILISGNGYIEFDTECDYNERFKMLRADFVPSIYSDNVKCDIQFGSFDRSTRDDTSIEKAQFEILAHKWVDLSNQDYGVSLINDCKYGHRVKEGMISLNLLRSPVFPDPTADRGRHRFKYAFYPHKGGVFEGDTIELGYHFNMTPLVCDNDILIKDIVACDKKNIVIETLKKSENQDALIFRLYECSGQATRTDISTSIHFLEAYETDMLENIISNVDLKVLSFTPFEVKTIMLKLDRK